LNIFACIVQRLPVKFQPTPFSSPELEKQRSVPKLKGNWLDWAYREAGAQVVPT
jgi:hypothetical protein